MSNPLEFTTRITDLIPIEEVDINDEIPIIDKDDLEYSADGSDRKISPRFLVETASIRPSNNLTVSKKTSEWISQFRDDLTTLKNSTGQATTGKSGTVTMATDSQARNKVSESAALSPSNLSALIATTIMHGLLRNATAADAQDHTVKDAAITPETLFSGVLGASSFGAPSHVFKIPVKNADDNSLVYLTVQYGEQVSNGTFTNVRPESNPNHTHPFVDVGVTFPEPFETQCLMVIPMGFDVDPASYDEGTDYVFRTRRHDLNTAVIRGSRIGGLNTAGEQIGVRYIAIGY